MKERFEQIRMGKRLLEIVIMANSIIAEYQSSGDSLTLRQLYYQFVARGLIPNQQAEYKRLGDIVNKGRLAGLIDWRAIEDRTRVPSIYGEFDMNPEDVLSGVCEGYSRNPWEYQTYRPEVWVEKESLIDVVRRACSPLWVPHFACRGYTSQSAQYRAGKRLLDHFENGLQPVIIHLGDHDPSGIDMTRDNTERLSMFARMGIEVRRIALNMDQIEQYNPPPNPAKETDSRAEGYIAEFGNSSWELDALDPPVLRALITAEIEGLIDQAEWDRSTTQADEERDNLTRISRNYDAITDFLDNEGL